MNNNRNTFIWIGLLVSVMLQPLIAQGAICNSDETLTPVKGKIFNNILQTGATLGTAHLNLHKDKMKCGIFGQGAIVNNGSINFIHTFVCDDEVTSPLTGDTVHSQLTLNTTGFINLQSCPPDLPQTAISGTFEETSVPMPGTGRGIFTDVERGEIQIKGTINCLASIDMKFSGAICLKNP
ncbi:hypothetical protein SAMN05216419_100314 [Nitrosomonas cryotolerans]|uniref:Uncharacterized protein n=1 Tax=Nitrosomonas cryotolerans ATCC 49181 TaxID=1131553 RepID=A0A1N6J8Y9_9PROT|nr:hypothetical protein [Nitrosomonas cryotolerans]SFP44174.1 hypothetical protein SAMN05216419_100314 [Nitrosomonas cryotolerans]SIO40742.1 hypothetical protein SAMN02743940_2405 [Nitrosomonas cryotolerans ATCC 49181]